MFYHNNELKRKFLIIVIITIVVITFLCILSGLRIYKTQLALIKTGIKAEASRLERTISSSLDYSQYLLEHINKQIYQNGADIDYIGKLVKSFKSGDEEAKSIFASSLFSWVDKDLHLSASNNLGALIKPIDYSNSEFWQEVARNPTDLHLGSPSGGSISGQWVIPATLGLIDKEDKFIGAMVMGIDIGVIQEKLERSTSTSSISFVLIDRRTKEIILNSSNDKFVSKNCDPTKQIYNIDFTKLPNGTLSEYKSFNNDIPQSYYQSFATYPYVIVVNYDASRITQKLISILLPQVFIFCSIIFALAILLYLIHYNILSPIVILSKFADSITSGKPLEKNLNQRQMSYEINNLYNHLLCIELYVNNEKLINKQLFETKETLRLAFNKTEQMNEEIKIINASLEEKVQERTIELENALAAKTEFLNNISHEVRTPIQGVTALSQGLVDHWHDFPEAKRIELAKQVASNAKRLFTLVSNLLDLSKFTANKMNFDMKINDLAVLIEEMIEECHALYLNDNKKIKIIFKKPDYLSSLIVMDKDRMIQVLRNLFANAIKFTHDGSIIIELQETEIIMPNQSKEKAILFSIQDEGIGIPENELTTIFEPFTQSSRTKTKAGGTGLGLTIVKEIITGHKGKIWAENNKGKGAKFSFIIPLMQKEQKELFNIPLLTKEQNQLIQENVININRDNPAKILIIDDEESCLMSMEILLHGCFYHLITISGGQEALNYINNNYSSIDLILLDLMMPDMYGLNLLAEIKNNPYLNNIPVILQSGISDEAEIRKAYSMGIIDFIKKPYQRDKIISSIERVFQQ